MSQAGDVLRRAAADVEVRGSVKGGSDGGDHCAQVAIFYVVRTDPSVRGASQREALETLLWSVGLNVPTVETEVMRVVWEWNDSQPSKAVVAAEMRSAADLADLLYG